MEREIYVDILVFLNTTVNFFLLQITACLAGRRKRTEGFWRRPFSAGLTR